MGGSEKGEEAVHHLKDFLGGLGGDGGAGLDGFARLAFADIEELGAEEVFGGDGGERIDGNVNEHILANGEIEADAAFGGGVVGEEHAGDIAGVDAVNADGGAHGDGRGIAEVGVDHHFAREEALGSGEQINQDTDEDESNDRGKTDAQFGPTDFACRWHVVLSVSQNELGNVGVGGLL